MDRPRFKAITSNTLSLSSCAMPGELGLMLGCWSSFSTLSADQRRVIFGVEWITMRGLLTGGSQGDVHSPVVGQDHDLHVAEHLLPLIGGQVGILIDLFLHLVCAQIVVRAERLRVDAVGRDAMLDQEALGA